MCWMNRSFILVPVFFRVLVVYCQEVFKTSKFTNVPNLIVPEYCFLSTAELESMVFWGKNLREFFNSVSKQSVAAGYYPWKTEFLWQSWQEWNVRRVAFSLNCGLCCWSCVFSPFPCPLIKSKCFSAVSIISGSCL